MQISLSDEARESLLDFIRDDRTMIATHLRQKTINMTFDRQTAQTIRREKRVAFINHMSPFIRWITKFNRENELSLHKISSVAYNTHLLPSGIYIFRIDRWALKGITTRERLAYGFISLENGTCVSSYEAETMFQNIFKNGSQWIYREYDKNILSQRYDTLEEYMYAQFDEDAKDFELENANMIQIKKRPCINYIQS